DVVVLFGGDLEFRKGSDTEILFRQISSVWYMANLDLYNCILMVRVLDHGKLNTSALVERQTHSQDIFNGALPPFDELAEDFAVDHAGYVDQLAFLLDDFLGESQYDTTATVFTDDVERLEALAGGVPMNINGAANTAIDHARCVKDTTELELLRHASEVAGAAHISAWKATLNNQTIPELTLEAAFVGTSQACGLRFQAYIPIVAAGQNGATLHYYKATSNASPGELLLLDASPEAQGYCSDVTRTYPVTGVFTDKEKLVYNIVLASADAGIRAMKIGADWNKDVCYGTEDVPGAYWALTQGLVAGGFILQHNASMEQLVFGDSAAGVPRAWSTFLPHSLGHGVGLNVHDMGVTYSGCGTVLQKGHVMTVEPGVYFIGQLLDEACAGSDAKWYNCDLMDQYREFGGVRLEDVVAVTDNEPDCMSCSLPRTTEAIEKAFAQL
ncbi:PEPD, partial [Symbiodinium microadriaticum]